MRVAATTLKMSFTQVKNQLEAIVVYSPLVHEVLLILSQLPFQEKTKFYVNFNTATCAPHYSVTFVDVSLQWLSYI